jgi:hypothetical protein
MNFKITGYDPSPGSLPSPPLTFIYLFKYPEGFSVHTGIDVRAGSPWPPYLIEAQGFGLYPTHRGGRRFWLLGEF